MYKISPQDKTLISKYKWHIDRLGYWVTTVYLGKIDGKSKFKALSMHRLIMGEPIGKEVDHINGIKADNRRENLRIASRSENMMNQAKRKNTSSKFKGVSWFKSVGKWAVQIRKDYKRHYFGYFESESEAAQVYNNKAKELFGKFAKLNAI